MNSNKLQQHNLLLRRTVAGDRMSHISQAPSGEVDIRSYAGKSGRLGVEGGTLKDIPSVIL